MPEKEKYKANRADNNSDANNGQTSEKNNDQKQQDANKKVAKLAAKGAADYFTGGKGGAVVDKLAETKVGDAVLNKMGDKFMEQNPGLKNVAQKLDDAGVLDAADKALSMAESGGAASKGAEGAAEGALEKSESDGKSSLMGGKSSSFLSSGDSSSGSSDSSAKMTDGMMSFDISKFVSLKSPQSILIIVGIGTLVLFIFGMIMTVLHEEIDESGEGSSSSSGSYCIDSNLTANELCRLKNEAKYDEWVEKFGAVAQQDYSRSGVFASITAAQAIIESGWGCSDIHNNLFGIKCHGASSCTTVGTHEEYNGQSVAIQDSFRTYESIAQSIEDHSKFLQENSIYSNAGVFSAKNYEEQARALKRAGYATASNYAESLINTIKTYNLDKFDVTVNTSSSTKCGTAVESASGWSIRTVQPTRNDYSYTLKNNVGQCVWYAQARAIEVAMELEKKGIITAQQKDNIVNKLSNTFANGGDWYDNTRDKFAGSSNIKDIKAGSLISWKKPGGYGHVAFIEEVTKKKVTITEGYAAGGNSCPSDWNCVRFNTKTVSLKDFYNSYGKYYSGAYNFSGYVYFLEPLA